MSTDLLLISGGASAYKLYGWGANGYNQYGYNSGSTTFQEMTLITQAASITQMTGNGIAMLALDTTGRVWAWGNNTYGAIGSSGVTSSPVVVLSNAVHVAALGGTSAAVKSDGTVWIWGKAFNGINGVVSTNYSSPVQITTISTVSQVELGGDASTWAASIFYKKTDGTVWAQGENGSGQLGNGTTVFKSSPVQVSTITSINKIQVTTDTQTAVIALKSDGTVWGWGSNASGRNGTGSTRSTPAQVQYYSPYPTVSVNLTGVSDIAVGLNNGYAITSGYQLYGWGNGDVYQLGDQNYVAGNADRSYAVLISQFYDTNLNLVTVSATQVSAGYRSVLCVSSDNKLYSWGFNDVGQAGNNISGELQTISKPTQVPGVYYGNASKSVCGYRTSGDAYRVKFQANYLIDTAGQVYGTGVSYLYNFTRTNTVKSPIQVGGSQLFLAVEGGANHGVAIGSDKFLYTTGANSSGELGTTISYTGAEPFLYREKWWPEFLQIGTNKWKKVAAGEYAGYAIQENNTLWSWGYNNKGQLGDGTTTTRSSPVQVISTSLNSPVLVSAGGYGYALAVNNDGFAYAWGDNQLAQLGIGTWSPGDARYSPIVVAGISNITQLSTSYTNAFALDSSGNIWAWGYNTYGGLGAGSTGTTTPQATPIASSLGTNILSYGDVPIQIASGIYHTLALSSDGTIWSVGANTYGQLGNLSTTSVSGAVQVLGISNIVSIGASAYSSYALSNDGKLWAWGRNTGGDVPDTGTGYLGLSTNVAAYSSPVLVGTYLGAYKLTRDGPSANGYKTMLVKPY